MPLLLTCDRITKMKVDAFVSDATPDFLNGVGDVQITDSGDLPSKYIIHVAGPVWQGGSSGEKEQLTACYNNALKLAAAHDCETVAFPLISAGMYGYPGDQALEVARTAISSFLLSSERDMTVYISVFDKSLYHMNPEVFEDIKKFVDGRYIDEVRSRETFRGRNAFFGAAAAKSATPAPEMAMAARAFVAEEEAVCADEALDDRIKQIDESFSQMLLRKIDESGMTDSECYKKANIDRKLFSKIRSDKFYRPSKTTVIAFAIALRLPLVDTKEMLMKAGFALSNSNKFDIIIEYFIERGNYDVFEINEALFAFDQPLLT